MERGEATTPVEYQEDERAGMALDQIRKACAACVEKIGGSESLKGEFRPFLGRLQEIREMLEAKKSAESIHERIQSVMDDLEEAVGPLREAGKEKVVSLENQRRLDIAGRLLLDLRPAEKDLRPE